MCAREIAGNQAARPADAAFMLERIHGVSSRPDLDRRDEAPTAEPTRRGPSTEVAYVGGALDAQLDAGLADFVRNASKPPPNDEVLYVGMNRSSAPAETAKLSKLAKVTELSHGELDSFVSVDGTSYDLRDAEGKAGFMELLKARGLPEMQAALVVAAIAQTNSTGMDELAHLALLWARGEVGGAVPSRVVLSGHSGGTTIWDGGGDGELAFADVQRLATMMPRAAAQIEDVHISACTTGKQAALDENRAAWIKAFPNLKTIWAYDGSAPREGGGHLADWTRATEGPATRLELSESRARGHVGVWDRTSGYRDGSGPLEEARARQATADARFDAWMSGARRSCGSDDPALVQDYRTYKALAARSDLPDAERAALDEKAEALLRARYYDGAVRRELARAYGEQLARAFQAVGLPPLSLATASRGESASRLAAFEEAASRGAPSADVLRAVEISAAIRALDSDLIPARWCTH